LIVSELGFGGIPIIRLDMDSAVAVLRRAYESGITLYDTANMYLDSEKKIGKALGEVRDKVFLATKTICRDAAGANEHLENSLRRLGTDYIDIYQFHQIAQEKDWDLVTGPGGALEAVARAQRDGKIRYIGVSSHNLAMAVKLVRSGLFSTIQFPFNFIEDAAKDEMHVLAREQGMGILAMKPFAGGMIDNAKIAFKFLRQHPDVIALPGFDSVEQVEEVVSFYEQINTVTDEDREVMEGYRRDLGKQFCRRCEYCQPCPQGVMITSAMTYKVVASRMSPRIAVKFAENIMKSVTLCTECRECVDRCPYELPIPDILKAHYDLFERHRAESQ
ncbi:MAG TPA: aldo/keto reductase, partial [Thermodesulfobacteriota bacterium]|nr:aldo/keto reductase [Thermodesulfobacteriota bacterium]